VTARQSGHNREATRAPASSAKSQCGGLPTASILKTRDQPEEEATSIAQAPCGNSDSTGRSPALAIHQASTGLTNDRPHAPHLVARTTTTGVDTKHPVSVRTGQPHPAANPPSNCCLGVWFTQCSDLTQPGSIRVKAARRAPVRSSLRCGPVLSLWSCGDDHQKRTGEDGHRALASR
jgi:hypothetical protein